MSKLLTLIKLILFLSVSDRTDTLNATITFTSSQNLTHERNQRRMQHEIERVALSIVLHVDGR